MPLPSSLVNVGDRSWTSSTAAYLLYVYKPSEEYAVRRDLGELRLWLEAKQVNCVPISLADLFWQALEESGWLEPLLEEERRAKDSATLGRIIESVGEVLREPPTLRPRPRRAEWVRAAHRCIPLPGRRALPCLSNVSLARGPTQPTPSSRHPALPGENRRLVRPQLHGSL